MKLNKAVILGTTLAMSLTFTACKGQGEAVISDQKGNEGIEQQIGGSDQIITESPSIDNPTEESPSIENPSIENPSIENPTEESPVTEEPVDGDETQRFAEGAGKGIENSDIKYADENFNTKLTDLVMRIEEGSVSPSGLTLIFDNSGDNEYQYGSYYYLEKREAGDQWIALPLIVEDEVMWTEELYTVLADQPSVSVVNWEKLYGALPSGEYRIIKQSTEIQETGDPETFMHGLSFKIE